MDKAPVVASAVLVSALHLLGNNAEIVKRWTNEIQEAVNSKSNMVQVRRAPRTACLGFRESRSRAQRASYHLLAVAQSLLRVTCLQVETRKRYLGGLMAFDHPVCQFATPRSAVSQNTADGLRACMWLMQFHGVALLHALRAGDRLAVSKLVTSLTQKNVRSSLAQCLLVR